MEPFFWGVLAKGLYWPPLPQLKAPPPPWYPLPCTSPL